jgi:hypothetical protein
MAISSLDSDSEVTIVYQRLDASLSRLVDESGLVAVLENIGPRTNPRINPKISPKTGSRTGWTVVCTQACKEVLSRTSGQTRPDVSPSGTTRTITTDLWALT